MVVSCGFLIPKILAFVRMKNYDFSDGYNCSDPITNEVIRLGNENNKKLFTYNKICLFSDAAILSCFVLGVIYLLIVNLIPKKREYTNFNREQKEKIEIPDAEVLFGRDPSSE